ncbi:NAD(P)-binding domain-containing protein [Thermopolyspora sp. NPDC052614]|uniref:NAD(P)-binding domain-containing protein n=1 Tax=Thermopolyspora sp. NPDC052614 TaxID=3155682 RepID=UPI003418305E
MIAFLGLGRMGAPMARRLVAAGHRTTVWNRTPRTIDGAVTAPSPAAAVADADLVITMLRDGDAVASVLAEALPGLRPGTTVVEMSTIGPDAVARLRALLPAEVRLVDAPVLGSVGPAAEGTLTVLAGGDLSDLSGCREVLEVFGRVRHAGPLGAGAALKLAVMSALVPAQVLLAETFAYADAAGVPRDALAEVLDGTFLGPLAARLRQAAESAPTRAGYALDLAAKDLGLAAHPSLTLAAAARDRLLAATTAGHGDHDLTAALASGALPSPTRVLATETASGDAAPAPASSAPSSATASDDTRHAVRINPPSIPAPAGHYAHAIRTGDLLFVSGQAALDENGKVVGEGDLAAQSEFVFDCLERILADQGCTFHDVVNMRSYLTDISRLREYGAVRMRRMTGEPPTSTTVEVPRLFRPGLLIEVDVVAAIPR